MVIVILINLAILIYVFLKYYRFSKDISNDVNENFEDKDSIIIGYINDVEFNNNFDLILAEIIDLNIKGYITINYDKKDLDKYNYTIKQNVDIGSDKLNKYEMLVLNFLFLNKTEITKIELEEKLSNSFKSYNARFNEVEEILRKKLLSENMIDEKKKSKLANIKKRYIKISVLITILITILSILNIIENSLLYMSMYILEVIVISILLSKATIYTNKGQILKYNIDRYKINLENKEFFKNKNEMKDIVLNKEFANSLALHINTEAKKAFIDDRVRKDATEISKKVIIKILIGLVIMVLVGIILAKITKLLSASGISFWLYIILTIACAGVADVTLSKKIK